VINPVTNAGAVIAPAVAVEEVLPDAKLIVPVAVIAVSVVGVEFCQVCKSPVCEAFALTISPVVVVELGITKTPEVVRLNK